jgi:hypothetical protein
MKVAMLRRRGWILASAILIGSLAFVGSCSSGSDSGSPGQQDAGVDVASGDSPYDSGYVNFTDTGGTGGGGAGGGIVEPDGAGVPCNVSVSGPTLSVGLTCTTTTEYFSAVKRTTFNVSVEDPRPLQLVSITIQEPGFPKTGTWTSTDPGASGSASIQEVPSQTGTPTWQCVASGAAPEDGGAPEGGDEGGLPEGGSSEGGAPDGGGACYTLDITVGQGIVTSTGESFGSTGTFTSTLSPQPGTGASGNVTLRVTF